MNKSEVMVGALAAALGVGAAVVEPKNTDEILTNPGMGICHFYYSSRIWAYGAASEPGDTLDWMPGTSVIYMRLPWCYLEPEEGVFRWDILDSKARPWIAAGKKVAFRISCMDPTLCSIPDWAIKAGIRGSEAPYRGNPKNALVFEPVWDDPVLIEKVTNFYRAFAARYDGNPDVAFVDLGSFGLYGEGHAPKLGEIREKDPAEYDRLCRLHLDLLRKALPRTYLVVSEDIAGGGWIETDVSAIGTTPNPFTPGGKPRLYDHPILAYARSIGYGLRDDSIMCNAQRPWGSDHFGRLFARESPVVIESGHLSKRLQTKSWRPELLRKCIEEYHASYISTHGFPEIYWKTNKDVWKDFANRLGYRFELRKVEYPDTVKVSERVTVKSVWANVGVAPEYANSSLTWNLLNEKGVVCWSVTDPRFGFRSLPPRLEDGEKPVEVSSPCTFGYTAQVPNNGNDAILNWCIQNRQDDPGKTVALLKPGTYTLAVSVGRNDGKPEIALPLVGGKERIYPIGPIRVVNGADSAYGVRLGGNQMPNGNFEGVGGWRTLGDYARIEKGAGRDGTTGFVVEKSAGAMINCPHSERIPVESGLAYRIEMWAKCLKGEGERLVPYVVAYDANGRENLNVGCRIARVTDNDPRDDGWYRFEGVTKAMPSDVRTAELVVWAPDKLEGAVAVDDIVVYPVSANTLGTVVCSAYQARASKGAVTFKAACSANAGRFPPDTLRAEAVCTAGGRTDRRPATVRDGAVEATLPVGAFAFGRNEVVLRLFAKDGTELGSGACGFTRDREEPPRRVTIDRYGRTLVDGKPFLPLGLYFSKVTEENLTKLREGPFNCIMPYRPKEGDLDLCRRKGVMMIGSLSGWFRELRAATPEKAAEINGRLWDRVRRNREHPALLAWYLADEVPLAFEDLLRARNEKVHELDPSHPTWIVLDKPDHVSPLAQGFDVIGVDAYPIGNHGSAENTTIGKAAGWAERAKRTTYGFRPMWNVPQLFNWASYRKQEAEKNPAIRWPTEEEMRSMVWQSVAAGANGIVGYSFFDINERENYDEKTKAAKWAEVCRVFNEVKAHERELLSAPGPEPVCSDSGLVARTWSCEAGGTFVLVCNTLRKAVSGEVTVGGRKVPVSFGPIGVKTFTLGK